MSKLRDLLGYMATITPNKVHQESLTGYKNVVPMIIDATRELDEMEQEIAGLKELVQTLIKERRS